MAADAVSFLLQHKTAALTKQGFGPSISNPSSLQQQKECNFFLVSLLKTKYL
jgi:hypothetical protein